MSSVGAFEAKTHLSELLDRVSRGESITITRHGIPAAVLVPAGEAKGKRSHEEIVEGLRRLRERVGSRRRGKISVRELVAEGRRF